MAHQWDCYVLKLSTVPPENYSDDRTADCTHADDGPISLCNESIGDAQ